MFRDYLRANRGTAREYETLKRSLAASIDGTTFEARERYSLAKAPFVTAVLAQAVAEGYTVPPAVGA